MILKIIFSGFLKKIVYLKEYLNKNFKNKE